jgi:Leucine Rich repeat
LNVLSAFFARSDSTLTDVLLDECDFGRQEVACLVLEAFHTNRTITDLEIRSGVAHLEGTALGNSLADLMQKKAPQFKRLDLYLTELNVATIRASVHFNQHCERIETLKSLHLQRCGLGDEGIRLIVNALVGNTIMESLILTENSITAAGLPDITRIIESMPRLYTIYVERQPRSLCS